MTEETGITLQQEDETIEEIDCLWLMWDNLDWQENLRLPSTPKYHVSLPLTAARSSLETSLYPNQDSRTWLEL